MKYTTGFTTITAKYPGTCKRCRTTFAAGTTIRYGGPGRSYHLVAECVIAQAEQIAPPPMSEAPAAPDVVDRPF